MLKVCFCSSQFGVFLFHLNRGSSTWSRHTDSERKQGKGGREGGRKGGREAGRGRSFTRNHVRTATAAVSVCVSVCVRAFPSVCKVCVSARVTRQAFSHLLESRRFSAGAPRTETEPLEQSEK